MAKRHQTKTRGDAREHKGRILEKVFSKDSRLRNHRDRAGGLENKELSDWVPGNSQIWARSVPVGESR
ncbi:hypothetical protein HanXRQr2_Chr10g0445511 [Helianthus annuus]|uniref:Uncharacterized protein n=1 Tax=Helianthus annuus TaxID=4232 RepID=A0A9K3HYD6_HELAN|nr:hypothetical protein HanXRQr2_Chr10g0445511 [Helianthus annuus]KAJ0884154.1 hypothetical protein HanPSC8_Chr10g0430111 [Helianthus annuus]